MTRYSLRSIPLIESCLNVSLGNVTWIFGMSEHYLHLYLSDDEPILGAIAVCGHELSAFDIEAPTSITKCPECLAISGETDGSVFYNTRRDGRVS